jgi:hypothetical protein
MSLPPLLLRIIAFFSDLVRGRAPARALALTVRPRASGARRQRQRRED